MITRLRWGRVLGVYLVSALLLVAVLGILVYLSASPVLVVGGVFAFAGAAVLWRFPNACLSVSFWAMAFTPLLRRVVGGADAYTPNDPLVFLPALALVPLIIRRGIFIDRPTGPRALYLLIVIVAIGTFVFGIATGGSTGPLVLGASTLVLPILAALAIRPWEMRRASSQLLRQGRFVGILAALYGYVQYFAPFGWDLRWLESRREVVSSFGNAVPGEFRLFGPTSSPLSYALILSICICCWLFAERGSATWHRLLACGLLTLPLLLTSVRTSVFALIVAAMLVGIFRRSTVAACLLALTALVYAALPSLLAVVAPNLAGRYALDGLGSDVSFVTRLNLLKDALGPALFGIGLGPGGSTDQSTVIDNGYLASFLDLGLIGGVAILGVALTGLSNALSASLRRTPLVPEAAFAIIVIVLVLSQASAPVIQEEVGLFFWVGVLLISRQSSELSSRSSGRASLVDSGRTEGYLERPKERTE